MVKVLVVEDEASIREMIALNLRLAGMEAVEADSAEAALPLLEQRPGCDAAILDVMLPGLSGFEMCRRLREVKDTPVIIISALAKVITAYAHLSWVQHAFAGIRVCVCVLIFNAVVKLLKGSVKDWPAALIFAAVLAAALLTDLSPVIFVAGAAALGGCGYAGYKGYRHYINKKRGYAA